MRSSFRGHYPLNTSELNSLWSDGLVVLDTNVLLGMYRQSAATRRTMTAALTRSQPNLWLPHQVGLEFHRNRDTSRTNASEMHRQLTNIIRSDQDAIRTQLLTLASADPQLPADELVDDLKTATGRMIAEISKSKERLNLERRGTDPVLAVVEKLYPDEKIGPRFTSDELSHHRRLGAERTIAQQPPGYADAKNKSGDRVYGDYFLWAQLLAHAATVERDVIFVTDDEKADWRVAPGVARPELLDEFHSSTGKLIHIYSSQEFILEESRRHTKSKKASVAATRAADEIVSLVNREAADAEQSSASFRNWLAHTGAPVLLTRSGLTENGSPLTPEMLGLLQNSSIARTLWENLRDIHAWGATELGAPIGATDIDGIPIGQWFESRTSAVGSEELAEEPNPPGKETPAENSH